MSDVTVFVALEAFYTALEADGVKPGKLVWYRSILSAFKLRYRADSLTAITPDKMRAWVIEVRRAAKSEVTAVDKISALHRFWAWASGEYGVSNSMARIKRPARPYPAPKAPTVEHVRALFAALDQTTVSGIRDAAMLTLVVDTCLRISEVLALTPDDLDFAAHMITVRVGKGGKRRVVPFTRECEVVLSRWLRRRPLAAEFVFVSFTANRGEPLTYAGARQILRRLHGVAKLNDFFSWHKYRHFGAQQYRRSGGDALNLQHLLGHSDVGTTFRHYGNWHEDELSQAHEQHSALNALHEQKGI